MPHGAADLTRIEFCGEAFLADASGALFWPARSLLLVADLHLEKGSAFARTGQLLPPYDTCETLARLAAAIARHRPDHVAVLGDGFHDAFAGARLGAQDAAQLRSLTAERRWTWILGNHDPVVPARIGGDTANHLTLGPIRLQHMPRRRPDCGVVAGHFHPKFTLVRRRRQVSGRCFVVGADVLILPAFGAYAGGLDARDPDIAAAVGGAAEVYVAGRSRLYRFPLREEQPIGVVPMKTGTS